MALNPFCDETLHIIHVDAYQDMGGLILFYSVVVCYTMYVHDQARGHIKYCDLKADSVKGIV